MPYATFSTYPSEEQEFVDSATRCLFGMIPLPCRCTVTGTLLLYTRITFEEEEEGVEVEALGMLYE